MINNDFRDIVSRLEELQEHGLALYSQLADAVINDRITDPHIIELILDGLLDFSYSDRYEILYKKICRHIFQKYTALIEEHVAKFYEHTADVKDTNNNVSMPTDMPDDEEIDVAAREVLERHRLLVKSWPNDLEGRQ